MVTNRTALALVRAGVALFVLGLLTGVAVPAFTMSGMGVAHLEGALGGLMLGFVGLLWPSLALDARVGRAGIALLCAGSYGWWACGTLPAVLATGPLAAGATGHTWPVMVARAGLVSALLAMTGAGGIVLYGLRRSARTTQERPVRVSRSVPGRAA